MKVFVYYNLHKKVWSVKALEGERKGRVIRHALELKLKDVIFKVSEAGRQRVLTEKRKNVHAGVVGYLTDEAFFWDKPKVVTYNPYKAGHFYDKETNEPVHSAPRVYMAHKMVWAG